MSHAYFHSFFLDINYYVSAPFQSTTLTREQLLDNPPSERAKAELKQLAKEVCRSDFTFTEEREVAIALYGVIIALAENRNDDAMKTMCKVTRRVHDIAFIFYTLDNDPTTRIAFLKQHIDVTYPHHYTLRATLAM